MLEPSRRWTPKHSGAYRRTSTWRRFRRRYERLRRTILLFSISGAPAIGVKPMFARSGLARILLFPALLVGPRLALESAYGGSIQSTGFRSQALTNSATTTKI